jgi:TonB family protein
MFSDFDRRQTVVFFRRRRMESHALALGLYGALLTCAFMNRPGPAEVDVELEAELEDLEVEDESAEQEQEEAEPEQQAPKPKPAPSIKPPDKRVRSVPQESSVDKAPPPEYDPDAVADGAGAVQEETKEAEVEEKPKAKKRRRREKVDPTQPINRPEKASAPEPDPGNKPPEYPAELRASGITGMVVIKLHVHRDGRVKGAKILKANTTATGEEEQKHAEKLLKKAVINAVRHWKYEPSVLDGEPISVWIIVNFPFRLSTG